MLHRIARSIIDQFAGTAHARHSDATSSDPEPLAFIIDLNDAAAVCAALGVSPD